MRLFFNWAPRYFQGTSKMPLKGFFSSRLVFLNSFRTFVALLGELYS